MADLASIQKVHAQKLGFVDGSDEENAHREGFMLAAFIVNSFISDTCATDGIDGGMAAMVTVYQELLEMKGIEPEVTDVVH